MRPSPHIWWWFKRALTDGTLASLVSGAVLAWRGRGETGSAVAAINAPSHWIYGREALSRNDLSLSHTLPGALLHHGSSVFWALFYDWLQRQRHHPTAVSAVSDAALVTAVAALVDLKVVPERLTPGFEKRLSNRSLLTVYLGFGAGLALGGLLLQRRH